MKIKLTIFFLALCTIGFSQVTVIQNQNVGVGTETPAVKLDVNGIIMSNDKIISPIYESTEVSATKLRASPSFPYYGYSFTINPTYSGGWARNFGAAFYGEDRISSFGAHGSQNLLNRLYFDISGGDSPQLTDDMVLQKMVNGSASLGIGTNTPSHLLTLQGNNNGIRIESSSNPAGYNLSLISNYNYKERFSLKDGNFKVLGHIQLDTIYRNYLSSFYNLSFYTGTSVPNLAKERMTITNTGLVGINTVDPTSILDVNGQIQGGFGAAAGGGGESDWNAISNSKSGNGHRLLKGNMANGPGGTKYYHPFTYEYNSKNGTGNRTQFAIPYNGNEMYFRWTYSGNWSDWIRIADESFVDTYFSTISGTQVDWNDATDEGVADQLLKGTQQNGMGNSNYFYPMNISHQGNNRLQIAWPYINQNSPYLRGKYDGAWNDWKKMWTEHDFSQEDIDEWNTADYIEVTALDQSFQGSSMTDLNLNGTPILIGDGLSYDSALDDIICSEAGVYRIELNIDWTSPSATKSYDINSKIGGVSNVSTFILHAGFDQNTIYSHTFSTTSSNTVIDIELGNISDGGAINFNGSTKLKIYKIE